MYTDEGLKQGHYFAAHKSNEGWSVVSEEEEDSPGKCSMMAF